MNATQKEVVEQQPQLSKYIVFEIGGQGYALPLTNVVEVIWMVALTPTPAKHDHIEGVINLRGNILPILNIRSRLGIPDVPYGIHHRILIVVVESHHVGFVVDTVSRVEEFEAGQVETPREFDQELTFVNGLIKLKDRIIFCIELEKLFSPRELHLAKEVASVSGTVASAASSGGGTSASATKASRAKSKTDADSGT
ncbi:MAG: chemotaxis protein CheW [Acidobacteria bacterium]|nr:chemotaxis protein CheW [Acidobacteriota bacterium]